MKKITSLILSLLMIFSVVCVGYTVAAEGNVITVGDGADYEILADAVTAASEGDTIQLISDIIAKNVTLNKSITIDTNGFTWTGGEGNGPGSNKANCGTVSSGVTLTIINSQRTEPITSEVTKFDVQANSANRQGSIVLSNNSNLVLKNVAVQSTNGYTNNQPCAVYFNSAKTATLTMDNCYLTSDNWGAIGANYSNSLMQISAKNSIFSGATCSVFYAGTPSSTPTDKSEMSFENCTFVKHITAMASNADTSIDTATATFETVTYNFTNCTAPALFAPSATAVFDGNCAFETVKSTIVVTAAEGVSLYADEEGTTNVTSGAALEVDSPVYSKAAATTYQITIDGEKVGEVNAGADYTLPKGEAKGFICYTDGTNYYAENTTLTPEKNLNLTSVTVGTFKMVKGASMRVKAKTGIRFYTNVDIEKINELKNLNAEISMGTLIAPENLLNGKDLTLSINTDNYVKIPYISGIEDNDWFTDVIGGAEFSGMVGSIVDIKETNINRRFVGRGYITVTIGGVTKTVYADYAENDVANNTRTIAYIADAVRRDTDNAAFYEAHKSVIDIYANEYNPDNEY